jgi:hypothetical protein
MRIQEFEQALREALKSRNDRPVLAMLTGDGSIPVPSEFARAATTLGERSSKGGDGSGPPDRGAPDDDWL